MLKRKISENLQELDINVEAKRTNEESSVLVLSPYFPPPLWKRFYDLECELNEKLQLTLNPPQYVKYVYNPVVYAAELHCMYLQRFLDEPKRLLFVGMNPGPHGMGQTGIPFGNIKTVRELMKLTGNVEQPPSVHPKRLVKGMNCTVEERSGVRIWNLFARLAGSLESFFSQCFVHNFCPLAFFDTAGKNITPSELKGEYKAQIRDACLSTLYEQIELINPVVIVAIGEYVFTCMKNYKKIPVLKMPHPSPRAINNTNWPEKAEKWLLDNDLLRYIKKT